MSAERHIHGKSARMAHMSAMNYRITDKKDMLTERNFRMETQMHDNCSQTQLISNVLQKVANYENSGMKVAG